MSLFKIILVAFLNLTVLIGTAGVHFQQMKCLQSGYSKFSLGQNDCCSHEGDTRVEAPCCEVSNLSIDLLDYNPEQKRYSIKTFEVSPVWTTSINSFVKQGGANYICDLPPPRTSKTSFIILFQSFLC